MRRTVAVIGVLASATVAIYAVALHGAFIFDDLHHIVENRGIRSFQTTLGCGYQETRPVFLLSLAVNYAIGGYDPFGYHLVNVLLHVGCAALVWALARATRLRLAWFPEIAALLFAVHPLATEAVTYINSRSGVLAALFGLAAMVSYLRYHDHGGRAAYVVSIMCTALAMGSKESAVVVPVLLWMFLVMFRHRGSVKAAMCEARALVPHGLCIAIVLLLFVVATNPHRGTIGAGTIAVVPHALTQLRVLAFLLRLQVVPVHQNLDYDFPVSDGIDAAVIGAAAGLIALVALGWWLRRRAPVVSVAIAWWLIALAPTNSIVPFRDFIAERHMYLALVGYSMAVAWVTARAAQRRRRLALGAVIVYLVALAALTVARNRVLADPIRLWRETVASSPNKARPHVNLGVLLVDAGRIDEGGAHLERAVAIDPRDGRAQFDVAVYRERRGDVDGALRALRAAVAVSASVRYRAQLARIANNAGVARLRAGGVEDAEGLFREALAARPDYPRALYNLATVRLQQGDRAQARSLLDRALARDPHYARARALRAQIMGRDR